jgi:hypothetical protein
MTALEILDTLDRRLNDLPPRGGLGLAAIQPFLVALRVVLVHDELQRDDMRRRLKSERDARD